MFLPSEKGLIQATIAQDPLTVCQENFMQLSTNHPGATVL